MSTEEDSSVFGPSSSKVLMESVKFVEIALRFSSAKVAQSRLGSKVYKWPFSRPANQYIPETPKAVPNSTTTSLCRCLASQEKNRPMDLSVRTWSDVREPRVDWG